MDLKEGHVGLGVGSMDVKVPKLSHPGLLVYGQEVGGRILGQILAFWWERAKLLVRAEVEGESRVKDPIVWLYVEKAPL